MNSLILVTLQKSDLKIWFGARVGTRDSQPNIDMHCQMKLDFVDFKIKFKQWCITRCVIAWNRENLCKLKCLAFIIIRSFEPNMQPDESVLSNLKKCISLREKYINSSIQSPFENPQNIANCVSDPPKIAEEDLSYYHKDHSHPFFSNLADSDDIHCPKNVGRAYHLNSYRLRSCFIPPSNDHSFELGDDGVFKVYNGPCLQDDAPSPIFFSPSIKEFFQDLEFLLAVIHDGPTKSLCFKRLKYLDASFGIYLLLNEMNEVQEQKVSFPPKIAH